MANFLSVSEVDSALFAFRNQIFTISFMVKNGEMRTYTGRLNVKKDIVGSERGKAQAARMANDGQVRLYIMGGKKNGQSRSFYKARVTGIRCAGQVIGEVFKEEEKA